jgi:hypothetical protein
MCVIDLVRFSIGVVACAAVLVSWFWTNGTEQPAAVPEIVAAVLLLACASCARDEITAIIDLKREREKARWRTASYAAAELESWFYLAIGSGFLVNGFWTSDKSEPATAVEIATVVLGVVLLRDWILSVVDMRLRAPRNRTRSANGRCAHIW